MHALGYALGFLLLCLGVAGVVLPVLPGSLLLVGGVALVAWADGFAQVGWGTVILAGGVRLLIWLVDLAAAALGTKLAGASRWALLGASVGLLVGLFFGLPGVLLGPAVGAVVLEYAQNPDFRKALRAGGGAFAGFLVGSVVKLVLALALVGLVVTRLAG